MTLLTGRCGRENEMRYFILYPGYKIPNPKTDREFMEFCLLQSNVCLPKRIPEHFLGKNQPMMFRLITLTQ